MSGMCSSEEETSLIKALKELVSGGRALLGGVEKELVPGGSKEDIANQKLPPMFGLIAAGATFFNSLSVKTKGEAESLWEKHFQNTEVQENVEELLQLEADWDGFLARLDSQAQMSDQTLSVVPPAHALSPDIQLTNVRTKESVSLGQYLGKGQKLLLVLLRHFG